MVAIIAKASMTRYMAVPAMPGAGLVVVEAKLVLGGLETVLDRPVMAFDGYEDYGSCARSAWMSSEVAQEFRTRV